MVALSTFARRAENGFMNAANEIRRNPDGEIGQGEVKQSIRTSRKRRRWFSSVDA